MIAILADTSSGHVLLRLLGRFHPAVVHFPIALISIAALLEGLQIARRKPGLSPATPYCLVLGAASALAASLFGWLLEDYDGGGGGGSLVDLHKWVGIGATAVAVVAALLLRKAADCPKALLALRGTLFLGAALVGGAGYLGGDLVFGQNHLLKGLFGANGGSALGEDEAVDFNRDVAPIFDTHCIRCHGPDKQRAKLDLKTKADTCQGGKNGKCVVPGQPHQSMLYTLLIEPNPESRMPPKEQPLSKEQIDIIRRWIEQGAN